MEREYFIKGPTTHIYNHSNPSKYTTIVIHQRWQKHVTFSCIECLLEIFYESSHSRFHLLSHLIALAFIGGDFKTT